MHTHTHTHPCACASVFALPFSRVQNDTVDGFWFICGCTFPIRLHFNFLSNFLSSGIKKRPQKRTEMSSLLKSNRVSVCVHVASLSPVNFSEMTLYSLSSFQSGVWIQLQTLKCPCSVSFCLIFLSAAIDEDPVCVSHITYLISPYVL